LPFAVDGDGEAVEDLMEWHELEKMKVDALRELAKEQTDLEGVTGLRKDDLVEAVAKKLGIAKPHKVIESGLGKRKIKARIRELKVARQAAIDGKDAAALRKARREMHGLKRKLRALAHLTH